MGITPHTRFRKDTSILVYTTGTHNTLKGITSQMQHYIGINNAKVHGKIYFVNKLFDRALKLAKAPVGLSYEHSGVL